MFSSALVGVRFVTPVTPLVVPLTQTVAVAGASSDTPLGESLSAQDQQAPADAATDASAPSDPLALQVTLQNYVVQQGDTVSSIASHFGISSDTIAWANNLDDPDLLQAGKTLTILPFSGVVHEVRSGDTVASIANTYGAQINDVIQANKLVAPYVILVGQQLAIPGGIRPLPKPVAPLAPVAPSVAADSTDGASDEEAQAAPATGTLSQGSGSSSASSSSSSSGSAQQDTDGEQVAAGAGPASAAVPSYHLGNTPQDQFIESIAPAAIASMHQTGVPASVTIAQAIIESYWGSSRLSTQANNYFGIKGDSGPGSAGVVYFDTWEVINGRNVIINAPFRAYRSLTDSFVDHGEFFVQNSRYAAAMAVKNNARAFAQAIAAAGYATAPDYGAKLIQMMDQYNLYQFDKA